MSRKGKLPVPVPSGVEVKIEGEEVTVKGPKGLLRQRLCPGVELSLEEGQVSVHKAAGEETTRFQGLMRTLVENMVVGVTKGFEKVLELIGVGFRAAVKGNELDLQLGFSHPTSLPIPEGIEVSVEKNTKVTVAGADKRLVGEFAASVRRIRGPEPYKGKGVRYANEYVRRKAGKAAGRK